MRRVMKRVAIILMTGIFAFETIPLKALATEINVAVEAEKVAEKVEETVSGNENVDEEKVVEGAEIEIATTGDGVTTGTLGDNNGIQWTYDASTKTLTVTGEDSGLNGIVRGVRGVSPFNDICEDVENVILQECRAIGKIDCLFANLYSLKSVRFINFDANNVTSMGYMFYGCLSLTNIDVSEFDTSNVTDMEYMFYGCLNLTNIDVSEFDTSNVTDMECMFGGCHSLSSIDVSGFDTSNVIDMGGMFGGCLSLANIDVSGFDTSNVIDMGGMFGACENLSSIDVSGFDTSKVTDMESMFSGCHSLASIDVSGFDTSQVTSMGYMFYGCLGLASIDVSGFDTSKVTGMEGIFEECINLRNIDVSGFDTSNVTGMGYMFGGCQSLSSIDVSGFDTSNVTGMSCMFVNCSNLKSLDLSGFDMSKVTDVYNMFDYCSNLEVIYTPKVICDSISLPNEFYDSQMNALIEITEEDCNKILVRKKVELTESSIPSSKYIILVTDNKGNALSRAKVIYDNQTGTTDANGKVQFDLAATTSPLITISKSGYITWTNADSNYQMQSSRYETFVLYAESEGNLKLKSAYYYSTTNEDCNLLTKTKKLNLKNEGIMGELASGDFRVTCEALSTDDVKEYQLWQNEKKISTSADGEFTLNVANGFVEGGNCYIKVLSNNGKTVDTRINLTFVQNAINAQNSIELMKDKLSIKVKDSIPYLGGSTVNIEIPKMPVDFQITEEKVYLGINTILYSSDEDTKSDNEIEKNYKNVKKKLNAVKKLSSKKSAKELKKLMKESKDIKLPGGKFDISVVGYAEADMGSQIAKGEIYICASAKSPTFGFDTVVWVVPVTVQIKGTFEGKVGGEVFYNNATGVWDGAIDFDATVELNAFGGIGAKNVTGVGTYGSAKAELESTLLGSNSGVEKVDLTGELGVKAYVWRWEYEKPFAYNTWHIYTRNNVKSYSAVDDDTIDLYNVQNYKVASLDYLSEESDWNGDGIALYNAFDTDATAHTDLTSLLESTYRNAQPVMVAGGNALYAAFLRADVDTNEIYVACTKMVDGVWSEPVRADADAIVDATPQLVVDENGTVWMAYARTQEGYDNSSMLSYAQHQSIVIGTINPETLEFTEVKEYSSTNYSHMQQLALVDGVPALVWVESVVTDDNSVLLSDENTIKYASCINGQWSDASSLCEVKHPVQEIVIGDIGIVCDIDMDDDMSTTEDRTLMCYDWQGNATELATGVTGNVSYGVLPGETESTFLWNSTDALCNVNSSIPITGITNEYVVNGNDIYYSAAIGEGAELMVVRMNSDGTFGEPIQLTDSGRYLENLSVVTLNDKDVVFGMDTAVEITEDSVIPDKNLVWAVVQAANDIRIESIDYDTSIVTPGESVPVTLTVVNAGDQDVNEINISVNDSVVATESVALTAGQSADIVVDLECPEALTEYTIQVADAEKGLSADYTQDNNSVTFKLGYANLAVDAHLQQIGDSKAILAEVTNEGTEIVSGTVTLVDEDGQLLGMSSFVDLESGSMILIDMPLFANEYESTLNVVVTTEQEELYTYDNTDTIYLYGEEKPEEIVTYAISYKLNGGIQNPSNPQTYLSSDGEIVLVNPSREGYQFNGWYSDAVFTQQVTSIPTGSTGNLTLYAQWKPNTYNVTFNANGGTGSMASCTGKEYDATFTLTSNTFVRTGYTFVGWNTQANGSGQSYGNGASVGNLTNVNGETVVLYAQWQEDAYAIAYNLNGGKNNSNNPAVYTINSAITLAKPTKTGYTFNGWYSDSNFKTKVTSITQGSTGNKTLYAKWTANKYTVKFNGNGATKGKMATLTNRVYDKSYKLKANTYTKKGYTFKGWNTKKNGKGKTYKNKATIKNLTATNKKTVTLYAQWKAVNYKITYNLNGGKNSSKNPKTYTIATKTITLKKPTKKGYTFAGWYSDKKLTKKVTKIKKGSMGNLKLYAKWVKNE